MDRLRVKFPPVFANAPRVRPGPILALGLAFGALTSCDDLRRYQGSWSGPVSADPNQQKGFAPAATLRAHVGAVSRHEIEASFDLPDAPAPARFEPIRRAAGDVLAELRLPSEPLRTYLGFVAAPDGAAPLLGVVSLFAEERIEVRLIRGADDVYAVFFLKRQGPSAGADAR
jgi:hypothetical protein